MTVAREEALRLGYIQSLEKTPLDDIEGVARMRAAFLAVRDRLRVEGWLADALRADDGADAEPGPTHDVARYEVFVERRLLRGDVEAILAEVRSTAFDRAARSETRLSALALRVAAAGALSWPDAADAVFDKWAGGPERAVDTEDDYLARCRCRQEWADWSPSFEDSVELRRLLELGSAVDRDALARGGIGEAIGRDPQRHLDALDLLAKRAPALHRLFLATTEPGRSRPDLSHGDEAAAAAFVVETEKAVKKDRGHQAHSTVIGVLCVLTGIVFFRFGWYGVAPLTVLVLWLCLEAQFVEPKTYRRIVRPLALEAVVREGCSPRELADAIRQSPLLKTMSIASFREMLECDRGLEDVHRALRFARPTVEASS